jgi:hypothetical protein
MVCQINAFEAGLPLFIAAIFLLMGLATYYVVDKRKKERRRIGQTYYMSMDMVSMIIMMGAIQSISIMVPLGRTVLCLNGLL